MNDTHTNTRVRVVQAGAQAHLAGVWAGRLSVERGDCQLSGAKNKHTWREFAARSQCGATRLRPPGTSFYHATALSAGPPTPLRLAVPSPSPEAYPCRSNPIHLPATWTTCAEACGCKLCMQAETLTFWDLLSAPEPRRLAANCSSSRF
jgi:hypothetical protein